MLYNFVAVHAQTGGDVIYGAGAPTQHIQDFFPPRREFALLVYTSEIGDNCVMFHNVTLGGTGKHAGKRHPTVGDNVLIGTGAILLGPLHIGNNVKIGANTFLYMVDIPDNCTVVGTPGHITRMNGQSVSIKPKPTRIPVEELI